jgi:hypothetical protein
MSEESVYRGGNWNLKAFQDYYADKIITPCRTQKAEGVRQLIGRGDATARYIWSRPGDGLHHLQQKTDSSATRVTTLSKSWQYSAYTTNTIQPHCDFAPVWLIQSLDDLREIPDAEFPLFARPCPRTPRHGFVNSRRVKNWEEAAKVFMEAQAADEASEMLLSWEEPANFSAVANSSGVTYGYGNAGVTAGSSAEYFFIPGDGSTSRWKRALSEATLCDIDTLEDIYLEAVQSHPRIRLVQARTGPCVSQKRPVISQHPKTPISHIVNLSPSCSPTIGDVLSWLPTDADTESEKYLDNLVLKHGNGLVVWAKNVSPSSHIVVQAICRNISVVFAKESPELKETLEKTYKLDATATNVKTLLQSTDFLRGITDTLPTALFAGISIPSNTSLIDYLAEWAALSLAGVHNMSAIASYPAASMSSAQKHRLGTLYAVSMAASVFVPLIGVMGEARYWPTNYRGDCDNDFPYIYMLKGRKASRTNMWEACFNMQLPDFIQYSIAATKDFTKPGWSSSYGGPKWAEAGFQALELFETLCQLIEGKRPLSTVIDQWNRAVMAAHNGGKVVDKFLPTYVIAVITSQPTLGFLSNLCGKIVIHRQHHTELCVLEGAFTAARDTTLVEARSHWLQERAAVRVRVEDAISRRVESDDEDGEPRHDEEE